MGEDKKNASQLREVHHLLTQGKSAEAQILLAQMPGETPVLRNELNYLQAWYAVVEEHWEDVAQQVRDFPVFLDVEDRESLLTHGSLRRRRPIFLLILGEMARASGYPEEAIEHIQHGLALLNERRMNIAEVRLLAHCSLGRLSLEMNQTAQALLQYETAQHLCSEEKSDHPFRAAILIGLCETYTRLGQFEQALTTGKQALQLLQSGALPGCQDQLLLLLSRVSLALEDYESALTYAQDARHIASLANDDARRANILLSLAEIQQKRCQMQEARASCEQALALLSATPNLPLNGTAFVLLGKIAESEWRYHPDQAALATEAQEHYEQAQAFFTSLHDSASLARVSKQLAQLLESRGQPEEALAHWKRAFTLSEQRG